MFNIVLFEPEIPPNTGNIIRLCANAGGAIHLIEPLGFVLDDKRLRRAGLDYGEWRDLKIHRSWEHFLEAQSPARIWPISTKGKTLYSEIEFQRGDFIVFGPETRGLPAHLLATFAPQHIIRIPMLAGSRSMNLSNAAAVIIYEAWRQNGFESGS